MTKNKKPYLSEEHKKSRLEFAKKYCSWTIDDWSKVIFSDETKINVFGSDCVRYTSGKDLMHLLQLGRLFQQKNLVVVQ